MAVYTQDQVAVYTQDRAAVYVQDRVADYTLVLVGASTPAQVGGFTLVLVMNHIGATSHHGMSAVLPILWTAERGY